jgi:hypothetical protein
MLKRLRPLLAAVALVGASGCYTVNADLPGTLRGDVADSEVERVGTVTVEKSQWFFLWGLVGETPKDFVAEELKKQVQSKGADGVANLTWQSQFGCVDLLASACTVGCVTPRSYKVTGDLVRIKKSPLAGKPAKAAEAPLPPSTTTVADAQQF